MKKLIFIILFLTLFLVACDSEDKPQVVAQSDNNNITTYFYPNQVIVDSKRNTVCWTYDTNPSAWYEQLSTLCLDTVTP